MMTLVHDTQSPSLIVHLLIWLTDDVFQVLFAFMVGLHNLYWYYGSQTYDVGQGGQQKLVHSSESFQGSVPAVQSYLKTWIADRCHSWQYFFFLQPS